MSAFLTVALVHILGAMSPGPDFAMITRNSLTYSRRTGILTAVGLGLGILMHTTYALLGIGFLIAQSVLLYSMIKYVGAAYLLFIGFKALTAKAPTKKSEAQEKVRADLTAVQAIRIGLLCNILNPKATLFFVALFSQVISPETPLPVQIFYGVYMALATFVWFAFVASVLTLENIKRQFERIQIVFERTMGAVLIALGIRVALAARE